MISKIIAITIISYLASGVHGRMGGVLQGPSQLNNDVVKMTILQSKTHETVLDVLSEFAATAMEVDPQWSKLRHEMKRGQFIVSKDTLRGDVDFNLLTKFFHALPASWYECECSQDSRLPEWDGFNKHQMKDRDFKAHILETSKLYHALLKTKNFTSETYDKLLKTKNIRETVEKVDAIVETPKPSPLKESNSPPTAPRTAPKPSPLKESNSPPTAPKPSPLKESNSPPTEKGRRAKRPKTKSLSDSDNTVNETAMAPQKMEAPAPPPRKEAKPSPTDVDADRHEPGRRNGVRRKSLTEDNILIDDSLIDNAVNTKSPAPSPRKESKPSPTETETPDSTVEPILKRNKKGRRAKKNKTKSLSDSDNTVDETAKISKTKSLSDSDNTVDETATPEKKKSHFTKMKSAVLGKKRSKSMSDLSELSRDDSEQNEPESEATLSADDVVEKLKQNQTAGPQREATPEKKKSHFTAKMKSAVLGKKRSKSMSDLSRDDSEQKTRSNFYVTHEDKPVNSDEEVAATPEKKNRRFARAAKRVVVAKKLVTHEPVNSDKGVANINDGTTIHEDIQFVPEGIYEFANESSAPQVTLAPQMTSFAKPPVPARNASLPPVIGTPPVTRDGYEYAEIGRGKRAPHGRYQKSKAALKNKWARFRGKTQKPVTLRTHKRTY